MFLLLWTCNFWRESPRRSDCLLMLECDLGNWNLLTCSFSLDCKFCPLSLSRSCSCNVAVKQKYVVETIWMVYVTESSIKTSVWTFTYRFWLASAKIYLSCTCPKQTSLVCPFPCLLNLTPTNLKWSASFSCLYLLPICRGQFPPGELPRLSTRSNKTTFSKIVMP